MLLFFCGVMWKFTTNTFKWINSTTDRTHFLNGAHNNYNAYLGMLCSSKCDGIILCKMLAFYSMLLSHYLNSMLLRQVYDTYIISNWLSDSEPLVNSIEGHINLP